MTGGDEDRLRKRGGRKHFLLRDEGLSELDLGKGNIEDTKRTESNRYVRERHCVHALHAILICMRRGLGLSTTFLPFSFMLFISFLLLRLFLLFLFFVFISPFRDRVKEWVRRMVRQIKNVHIDDCVLISAATGRVEFCRLELLNSSCPLHVCSSGSSSFLS